MRIVDRALPFALLLSSGCAALTGDRVCDPQGCYSLSQFAGNIDKELRTSVLGYVSVVGAPFGKSTSYGFARTLADPPRTQWTAETPASVAGISGMLTAVAALRILDDHHISVDSPISPWLPPEWSQHPTILGITFAELLTHHAGFRNDDNDTTYAALGRQIHGGIDPGDKRSGVYNGLDFAMFRVLLPYLEGFDDVDAVRRDENTGVAYKQIMRKRVFLPVGVTNADLAPSPTMALEYALPPGPVTGDDAGDWTRKGGALGWVLSANDLSKVLGSLARQGDHRLLGEPQKAEMWRRCLGWDCALDGGSWQSWKGKDGSLTDIQGRTMKTYAALFGASQSVGVVVLVNSDIPNGNLARIISSAWLAAAVK